eukprot:NODE_299_length_2496_cov_17.656314_g276_i0.p1 GENE.NODE_299_length_2496_cov_17.656314_g276_i0~~NODE_299_length_2496_cov_17.656314_g276_i0.p1  ORF type:complete len:629 (+),score=75.06 NODE_299_length_2496_cov_17.656314_g276_i0:119-2005(+)
MSRNNRSGSSSRRRNAGGSGGSVDRTKSLSLGKGSRKSESGQAKLRHAPPPARGDAHLDAEFSRSAELHLPRPGQNPRPLRSQSVTLHRPSSPFMEAPATGAQPPPPRGPRRPYPVESPYEQNYYNGNRFHHHHHHHHQNQHHYSPHYPQQQQEPPPPPFTFDRNGRRCSLPASPPPGPPFSFKADTMPLPGRDYAHHHHHHHHHHHQYLHHFNPHPHPHPHQHQYAAMARPPMPPSYIPGGHQHHRYQHQHQHRHRLQDQHPHAFSEDSPEHWSEDNSLKPYSQLSGLADGDGSPTVESAAELSRAGYPRWDAYANGDPAGHSDQYPWEKNRLLYSDDSYRDQSPDYYGSPTANLQGERSFAQGRLSPVPPAVAAYTGQHVRDAVVPRDLRGFRSPPPFMNQQHYGNASPTGLLPLPGSQLPPPLGSAPFQQIPYTSPPKETARSLELSPSEHAEWVERVADIVRICKRTQTLARPAELVSFLFLGDANHASNVELLLESGISVIVNCAPAMTSTTARSYPPSFEYHAVNARDDSTYQILENDFANVQRILDSARYSGKRVLVHCYAGINRSATLCIAYLMVSLGWPLLSVVQHVYDLRSIILTNRAFMAELVAFAHRRGLLALETA